LLEAVAVQVDGDLLQVELVELVDIYLVLYQLLVALEQFIQL
jgi:hypothetical protein